MISVIVCTHARSDELRHLLLRLSEQLALWPKEFELLVVNTGVASRTAELSFVVNELCRSIPVQVIDACSSPASVGRNRGAAAARGNLLWFLDDDVVPPPGWIDGVRTLAAEEPAAEVGGGPVIPTILSSFPVWVEKRIDALWGPLGFYCLDAGAFSFTSESPLLPLSANLFIRGSAFEALGGFDPRLGLGTGKVGEDTDLLIRAIRTGYRARYVPCVWVHHLTDSKRWSSVYLLTWYIMKVRYLLARGLHPLYVVTATLERLRVMLTPTRQTPLRPRMSIAAALALAPKGAPQGLEGTE